MQVSVETGDGLERRVHVELPAEQVDSEVDKRLKSMRGSVKMAGFRPGKVPLKVVEQNYGPQVRQEVVSGLLESSLRDALSQESLQPAGGPRIDKISAEPGQPLSYTAVFEVMPAISTPVLEDIEISVTAASVEDSDIENMVDTLRRQRMSWSEVERAAADGDQVIVNYVGRIDGEEFEGGSANDMPVKIGSGQLIAGFEEGLKGASAGDKRTLNLQFPEDYHAEDVAGKEVVFDVTINRVEEGSLPELDDDFLKNFGIGDGSEDTFRQEIVSNMERELNEATMVANKNSVMDALLASISIDLPKSMVGEEAQRLAAQMTEQMGGAHAPDPAEFEDQATRRVSLGLLLAELVKEHQMSADPEAIRKRVETIASSYEQPQEVINWYYGDQQRLAEVQSVVLEEQVVNLVIAKAKVTEDKKTFDELMKPGQN